MQISLWYAETLTFKSHDVIVMLIKKFVKVLHLNHIALFPAFTNMLWELGTVTRFSHSPNAWLVGDKEFLSLLLCRYGVTVCSKPNYCIIIILSKSGCREAGIMWCHLTRSVDVDELNVGKIIQVWQLYSIPRNGLGSWRAEWHQAWLRRDFCGNWTYLI